MACAASFDASAAISEADSKIYNLYVHGRGIRVGCAIEQPGFDAKFSRIFDPWSHKHQASISAAQAELERVQKQPAYEIESEIVHKFSAAFDRATPSERQEVCTSALTAFSELD